MEHFSVVQSLCRIGLAHEDEKFRKQVVRLRDRLLKDGGEEHASTLDRLLSAKKRETSLTPSRVEVSRAAMTGEKLTANVPVPSDRETSAALADVILVPNADNTAPIYTLELAGAIEGITQEWNSVSALKSLGVAPSLSCLFYGQPGTGKTVTAYKLAADLGLPIVSARIDGLVSSFLGTTARNIGTLFEFANRYRCILLLDEFDALAKMRDDPHEVGEIKRVVNTLLQNLDLRSKIGMTVAITNHERLLDAAIWRRFETQVQFPSPDFLTRKKMVERFLEPLVVTDEISACISMISEGATGAELLSLINSAKRVLALQKSKIKNPREVLGAIRVSLGRSALKDRSPLASEFLSDEDAFIISVLSDERFAVTQSCLAELLGVTQPTIARRSKRHMKKSA